MWKLTLYRDDSTTPVKFEYVKHVFWTAGNTVLVIAQYDHVERHCEEFVTDGKHHYVHWPRERFCWYRLERA
jgi:hypothetical protein